MFARHQYYCHSTQDNSYICKIVNNNNVLRNSIRYFLRSRYKTGGAEKGTVSVGKIGVESPLLKWQDTSETAIEETENVGFEVEEGGNVEFGSVCFDV